METRHIIKFYGNRVKNESNYFHKKAKWVNSVWTQDLYMLLKWESISWRKTLVMFWQFRAVVCREYTLPRDDESSHPRGWIQGNSRIGPVLEITTSYLWGKYGIEIRISSLSRDNSHFWVRISHGTKNIWLIQVTTLHKFSQVYLKNKRQN